MHALESSAAGPLARLRGAGFSCCRLGTSMPERLLDRLATTQRHIPNRRTKGSTPLAAAAQPRRRRRSHVQAPSGFAQPA